MNFLVKCPLADLAQRYIVAHQFESNALIKACSVGIFLIPVWFAILFQVCSPYALRSCFYNQTNDPMIV